MKPTWDQLMNEFAHAKDSVIADVDCTIDENKPLCKEFGVSGYPALKHGDPNNPEDYSGERDINSLRRFAARSLGPVCAPHSPHVCAGEKAKEMQQLLGLSVSELEEKLAKKENDIEAESKNWEEVGAWLKELYTAEHEKVSKQVEEVQGANYNHKKALNRANKRAGKA